ncbi:MAG: hypothetical protein PHH37_00965 [Paludibacter sp.]|nr:hypothetical protein [Paludibacter sp.]
MKNFRYIIIAFTSLIFLAGCEKSDRDTVDLSGDVNILSFTVNGHEAVVDNKALTVKLLLPPGTDLTQLKPVVEIPEGATVSPASGTELDFSTSATTPIEYTVYNKNVYSTYKVKIEEIKAKITLFKIGNTVGEIDEANKTITLYMTEGTDVSNVIPTITYTEGAEISPAIGTSIDLTNPVIYTLTYAGTQFTYTVSVEFGSAPGLVLFNGEDVKPEWGSIAAMVESPYANPKTDGINATPYCASIIRDGSDTDAGGKPWSGGALWNSYKVNIDPALYGSFTLMVLKNVAGDVQLEIQSDGEQNKDWLKVWYSEDNLGKWQKLTFVIPEGRTAVINNILVAPHCHDAGTFSTQRMYWDELTAMPK